MDVSGCCPQIPDRMLRFFPPFIDPVQGDRYNQGVLHKFTIDRDRCVYLVPRDSAGVVVEQVLVCLQCECVHFLEIEHRHQFGHMHSEPVHLDRYVGVDMFGTRCMGGIDGSQSCGGHLLDPGSESSVLDLVLQAANAFFRVRVEDQ